MATRTVSYAPLYFTATPTTNPTSGTVIVDSGALTQGMYELRLLPGASAAALFTLQHRDSTNASNIAAISIRAAAGQTAEYVLKFAVNSNERIRLVMGANLTGDAEGALQIERIA